MPAPLAFHVLGPLLVTRADAPDAPVALGGPRERVLLAALLVEHGRVVSVDGLARALWGDLPPATARHQVAIGVSRLRRAFTAAGAGSDVIVTRAPGYQVAGGWLDARCFGEHARRAHDALAAGDREEAARLLRAGLSLWRGPALSGVDRPFAEIEAARLEERRLLVTEELMDLELDLGRHEELAGDLLALVRAHPLALSCRELPPRAARLFRLLGLLDAANFAVWSAAALLGGSAPQTEDLLDQLVRAGLLEVAGRDCAGQARYRLHDLMRLYARERGAAADGCEERRAAAGRFFGAALHLAEQADRRLGNPFVFPLYACSPRWEPDEAVARRVLHDPVAWLDAERALLVGAVAQAAGLGMAGYAWELTSALGQFLSTSRHMDAWRDCAVRAAEAAQTAGDPRGEAAALLQYADWLGDVGRFGDAIRSVSRALALVTGCPDTGAQAACRTLLAVMCLLPGQAARAEQEAEQGLALLGRSAPPAARGRALITLGLTYLHQDRHADAAACFTRVLRIQQAAGSARGQAEARYRLGTVRLRQGRYGAAVRLLTPAMNSARQAGDLMTAMAAQIRLGQALLEMGRLDDARPLLDHAVRHVTADGTPRFRAIALEALGQLHRAQQQPQAAAPLIAEARELRRALSANAR